MSPTIDIMIGVAMPSFFAIAIAVIGGMGLGRWLHRLVRQRAALRSSPREVESL